MGRKLKTDIPKLRELHAKGMRVTDIAKQLGVAKGTISSQLKNLGLAAVRSIVVEQAPKFVEKRLDAIDQLCHINKVANKILDELTGEKKTTLRMVHAVKTILTYEKEPSKENLKDLKTTILRINQDKNTAIKACAEIRGQLGLQLEILQTLHDIKVVAQYHQELIELLRQTDPKLRDDFLARLKERQGLQRALRAKPVKPIDDEG